jgi:hypothetical protein
MVAYLSTNSTRRRYFGSALILTFPPNRKNLNNPFSWMRFGLAMCEFERRGGDERGVSASNAAALLPPLFWFR